MQGVDAATTTPRNDVHDTKAYMAAPGAATVIPQAAMVTPDISVQMVLKVTKVDFKLFVYDLNRTISEAKWCVAIQRSGI